MRFITKTELETGGINKGQWWWEVWDVTIEYCVEVGDQWYATRNEALRDGNAARDEWARSEGEIS